MTINLDTTRIIINRYKPNDVFESLSNGQISISDDKEKMPIIDYNSIPKKYQEIFDKNQKIVNDFILNYGPYYEDFRKKNMNTSGIVENYGIDKKRYFLLIREYFQSGFSDSALFSKRTPGLSGKRANSNYSKKPGRKPKYNNNEVFLTTEIIDQFQEGLNELLEKKRFTSITNAYDNIIRKYYTRQILQNGTLILEEEDRNHIPTYKQFYTFVKNHTTQKQFDLIKTSAQEVRNDKRLLLSDTMNGVFGPGDLAEIDACEVDLSLIDLYDVENVVSRPILYLMIDVATRVILAVSVAFENNSILGVTNLFLNLSDSKVEYCKKFGIDIDPNLWPSNIIPRRIRFDRGAECTSNQLEKIMNQLNIQRDLVSAGTGSLKGNVEQTFHQIHLAQNHLLENKGLIQKRFDSNHHEKAVLTIEEYTRIVINFVLTHNQTAIMSYKSSKDMIINNIPPVPIKLWDYLALKSGLPRQISETNIDQFRFSLLQEYDAKISREGIHFIGGHLYYNENDEKLKQLMYDAGDSKKPFKVRYDPRNVNQLYYLQDNQLMVAPINTRKQVNEGFLNLTYIEMKNLDLKNKKIFNSVKYDNEKIRRAREDANKAIINSAENYGENKNTNASSIREHRYLAQQNQRFDNSIATRMDTQNYIEPISVEPVKEVAYKDHKSELEEKVKYYRTHSSELTDEEKQDWLRLAEELVNE